MHLSHALVAHVHAVLERLVDGMADKRPWLTHYDGEVIELKDQLEANPFAVTYTLLNVGRHNLHCMIEEPHLLDELNASGRHIFSPEIRLAVNTALVTLGEDPL